MRKEWLFGAGVVLLAAWGLQAGQVSATDPKREGKFWVRTIQGSERLGPATHLEIGAAGSVTVHGAARDDVGFKLVQRVRARSAAEARSRMEDIGIETRRSPRVLVLDLSAGPEAELQLQVPRGVRFTKVDTEAGSVEVEDLEGSVSIETGAGKVTARRIGGTVAIDTQGGLTTVGDVGGTVRIDSAGGSIVAEVLSGEAIMETAGGDISVEKVAGPIRAFTAAGGIRIAQAGSSVTATTDGGPIEIQSSRGTVTARNSGGPIQVNGAHGVHCETASGTIRLTDISGALHVETASGSIVAQLLPGRSLGDSLLSTAGGDITVLLPGAVHLNIRAESESSAMARSIVSEFSGLKVWMDGGNTRAEGSINGGGPLLKLVGNGMIYIKRR